MRFFYSLFFWGSLFLVSGCTAQQSHKQIYQVVPVSQVQYVEATLIEGKTTKKEILDSLGMPDNISESSLAYHYYSSNNKNIHAKLHIIYKDGTSMNVILGYGLKHSGVLIHFSGSYDSQGRHIPSNVNTGFSIN